MERGEDRKEKEGGEEGKEEKVRREERKRDEERREERREREEDKRGNTNEFMSKAKLTGSAGRFSGGESPVTRGRDITPDRQDDSDKRRKRQRERNSGTISAFRPRTSCFPEGLIPDNLPQNTII